MSKPRAKTQTALEMIADLREGFGRLTRLIDYYEYNLRLIEVSTSMEGMLRLAKDALDNMNLDAVVITEQSHPGVYRAFCLICRDGYSGDGREITSCWRVPMRYEKTLDHHEEVLSSLSEQDLEIFCDGNSQEEARWEFFRAHNDTDAFLNDFYDNWCHEDADEDPTE